MHDTQRGQGHPLNVPGTGDDQLRRECAGRQRPGPARPPSMAGSVLTAGLSPRLRGVLCGYAHSAGLLRSAPGAHPSGPPGFAVYHQRHPVEPRGGLMTLRRSHQATGERCHCPRRAAGHEPRHHDGPTAGSAQRRPAGRWRRGATAELLTHDARAPTPLGGTVFVAFPCHPGSSNLAISCGKPRAIQARGFPQEIANP